MYGVILCGGSGTRLWPLSRKNFPKQFLSLLGEKSLLQETFSRIGEVIPPENIIFITNHENYFNVFNQIKDIWAEVSSAQILAEPIGRNTAPAIAYAVKHLVEKIKADPDEPILFLPADHHIGNPKKFRAVLRAALGALGKNIGTIGIKPEKPETGYGYIKKGKAHKGFWEIAEFREKPNRVTAEKYLRSGKYVWNSGMYLMTGRTFTRELKAHAPEIYTAFRRPLTDFLANFSALPDISMDVAISEKSKKIIVFEGDFGWSDIGSFDSLAELSEKNGVPGGRHVGIDSRNIFVLSESDRLVATIGVEDLVVIQSTDSVLIYRKGESGKVREVVEYLKKNKLVEIDHRQVVYRPWGRYEILFEGPNNKVKKIVVNPGAKLSLQSHQHRAEHWVVVQGLARVVNGKKEITLKANESTFIPANTRHRLENPGQIKLEIIEVKTGDYLEEDDIVRYEDIYERS